MRSLLSVANAKTPKGEAIGWYTAVMYLAPARESGIANVCPYATAGCMAACLYTSGRGQFDSVRNARIRRTREFFADRRAIIASLACEITRHAGAAARRGMRAAVRLNGTSDLRFERLAPELFAATGVTFYDYTKDRARYIEFLDGRLPRNYHLTYSRSERDHDSDIQHLLRRGGSVAVVTSRGILDADSSVVLAMTAEGTSIIDGDAHDLRFLDPANSLVLLRAKGRAKQDATGFVVRP